MSDDSEQIIQHFTAALRADPEFMAKAVQEAERVVTESIIGMSIEEAQRRAKIPTLERAVIDAALAFRNAERQADAYHLGSPFPGSPPPFTDDEVRELARQLRAAVDKLIEARGTKA